MPVSRLVNVTVTPGAAPPVSSLMVPSTVEVSNCAKRGLATNNSMDRRDRRERRQAALDMVWDLRGVEILSLCYRGFLPSFAALRTPRASPETAALVEAHDWSQ